MSSGGGGIRGTRIVETRGTLSMSCLLHGVSCNGKKDVAKVFVVAWASKERSFS